MLLAKIPRKVILYCVIKDLNNPPPIYNVEMTDEGNYIASIELSITNAQPTSIKITGSPTTEEEHAKERAAEHVLDLLKQKLNLQVDDFNYNWNQYYHEQLNEAEQIVETKEEQIDALMMQRNMLESQLEDANTDKEALKQYLQISLTKLQSATRKIKRIRRAMAEFFW